MSEQNPSTIKTLYVVQYVWKDGRGSKFAAAFDVKTEAVHYISEHIDDNVNLTWTIEKNTLSGLAERLAKNDRKGNKNG